MIEKIIILVESPFNTRDYKRFGIELLQHNGFKVEVWDLSRVIYPKLNLCSKTSIEFIGLKIFDDKNEAVNSISKLSENSMVITWFEYAYFRYLWIYKAISKSKTLYSIVQQGAAVEFYGASETIASKIKRIFWKKKIRGCLFFIRDKIISSIPFKALGIKPPFFWFAGTEKTIESFIFPVDRSTKVVYTHAFDYDVYLDRKDDKNRIFTQNAVFLDGYLPFHEDEDMVGVPHIVSADRYYPSLCRFFDYVERELGVKVDIAAHPRSFYEKHPDYFNKRTLRKGQTFECVRDAKLIIAHSSTALNFAVIYYRPIVFIVTEEIEGDELVKVSKVASWFGKNPINIDKEFSVDWKKELLVDKERYDKFVSNFIKKDGTEKINSWQIVANYIKKIDGMLNNKETA